MAKENPPVPTPMPQFTYTQPSTMSQPPHVPTPVPQPPTMIPVPTPVPPMVPPVTKIPAEELAMPRAKPVPFKYENNSAIENGQLTEAAHNAADAKAGQLVDNAAKAGVTKAQGDTESLQSEVAKKIGEGLLKKGFLDDAVDKAAAQTGLPKLPKGPRSVE